MRVADIMRAEVRTATSDISVSEFVVSQADAQVTGLRVVGARNRVIGVISTTDLINAQAATHSAEERQILWSRLVGVMSQTDIGRAVATGNIA